MKDVNGVIEKFQIMKSSVKNGIGDIISKLSLQLIIIIALIFTICFAVVLILFGANGFEIIKFFVYQIFYIQIPGLVGLIIIKYKTTLIKRLIVGYALGLFFEISTFAIWTYLNIQFMHYFFLPAISIIFVAQYLIKQKGISILKPIKDLKISWEHKVVAIFFFIFGVTLFLFFIKYFTLNPLPGSTNFINYYQDLVWHIGNTAEIKHHFPPQDPRVAGIGFNYYYFVNLHLASASVLTNINVATIVYRFYLIPFFMFITLGIYELGKTIGNNNYKNGIISVIFTIFTGSLSYIFMKLGIQGAEMMFIYNFFRVLYSSPTFVFGLLFFIPLLWICLENIHKGIGKSSVIIFCVFIFMSIGSKATVVPVILGGLVLLFLYIIILRRDLLSSIGKMTIVMIGCTLAIFAPMYYIMYSKHQSILSIQPLNSIKITFAYRYIMDIFENSSLANYSILIIIFSVIFVIIGFYGFRLLFIASHLARIKNKTVDINELFMFSIFFVSAMATYLISEKSSGEYYFLMYGLVGLNILCGIGFISLFIQSPKIRFKRVMVLITTILIIISLLTVFMVHIYISPNDVKYLTSDEDAYQKIFPRRYELQLSKDHYEALRYLEKETPKDSIILSYRFYREHDQSQASQSNARYFYYSAFSERRFVLEGYAYGNIPSDVFTERKSDIISFFTTNDSAIAEEILIKYNVDYVFVDQWVNNTLSFDTEYILSLYYENDTINIYSVNLDP